MRTRATLPAHMCRDGGKATATNAKSATAAPRRRRRPRLATAVAGGALTIAGIMLLFLPGPGVILIAAGIVFLARRFARVRLALARLRPMLPRALSVALKKFRARTKPSGLTSAFESRGRR